HRRPVRRWHEAGGFRALRTPASVVARLLAARALALAHFVEIVLAGPAAVRFSLRDERLGDFPVPFQALHLEKRALVPVEPEPAHRIEDRLHRGFGRALEVGVLDAQDDFAAVLSGVRPREKRGPRAADMEVAGRARSKPGSDQSRVSNRGIVLALVLLLVALIRTVPLTYSHFWDETVFLQHAKVIIDGRTNYEEFHHRPPFLSFLYALGFAIWDNVYVANLVQGVVTALTVVF